MREADGDEERVNRGDIPSLRKQETIEECMGKIFFMNRGKWMEFRNGRKGETVKIWYGGINKEGSTEQNGY